MTTRKRATDVRPSPDQRGSGADPSALAEEAIRRDRRRLRAWTIATASLWVVTTGYLLGLLWFYLVFVHPGIHESLAAGGEPATSRPGLQLVIRLLVLLLAWPVLLLGSALCTTFMILAARRSTLRQIQQALQRIDQRLEMAPPAP